MRVLVITAGVAFLLWAGATAISARTERPKPHRTAAQAYWRSEHNLVAALHREGRLGRLLRVERRYSRRLKHHVTLLQARVENANRARRLQAVHAEAPTLTYAIRLASAVYGVSQADMLTVARCESRLDRYARNGIYRGYWQEGPMFERSRFGQAGFVVWDPIAAALSVAETVAREGWSQWQCRP